MKQRVRTREDMANLLCKKYREIRQACDETILERMEREQSNRETFEWFFDLMQGKDPDAWIEEVHKTSMRTENILLNIDLALAEYADEAIEGGLSVWRDYDALYSVYFSNSKIKISDLAKKNRVKKSTMYAAVNRGKNRLTTILFGDTHVENVHNSVDK